MSLDGYTAGPEQTREEPLGKGGEELHEWMFATRTFRETGGREEGDTGLDDERMRRWNENVGAHIMGRKMFGPVRGGWGDEDWRGWWGDNPPYHAPVFVLTHHAREPVEMEGGTTFHFVTDGIETALVHAKEAAGEKDVAIAGGASTLQQYLRVGLVDEMEIHVVPMLLVPASASSRISMAGLPDSSASNSSAHPPWRTTAMSGRPPSPRRVGLGPPPERPPPRSS